MPNYTLNINGEKIIVNVDNDTPLLWVLRDELNLVGTKFGCGIAQCGACTVHVNNIAVRSCSVTVSSLKDEFITTIEGLSDIGTHPVQEAWKEIDVPQCGYCQSGQLISAAELLDTNDNPTDNDIDNAMSGNICRCGTYVRIKKAIKEAVELKKQA